jgi:hypothetical protein
MRRLAAITLLVVCAPLLILAAAGHCQEPDSAANQHSRTPNQVDRIGRRPSPTKERLNPTDDAAEEALHKPTSFETLDEAQAASPTPRRLSMPGNSTWWFSIWACLTAMAATG